MKINILVLGIAFSGTVAMADIDTGKQKSTACAACHGANGISVSADIPNLAGQKADYLVKQLKSFRAGDRKNPLMNAMAAQLIDTDIEDLVAFFSSLDGGASESATEVSDSISQPRMQFPDDYQGTYTLYYSFNLPERKQVRYAYANDIAMQRAQADGSLGDGTMILVEVYKAKLDADGGPIVGADGLFEKDELALYTAMGKRTGWGDDIPERLRNGDWSYAVFTTERTHKSGVNQAKCLACHKPLHDDDYMFSFKQLAEKIGSTN